MNQTRKSILEGEDLQKRNNEMFEKIATAATVEELKAPLGMLYDERMKNVEKRLVDLRGRYAVELEKESAEANSRFPAVLVNAKKWIGKEPKQISDRIEDIVAKYEVPTGTYDQETRNDDFYDLISHVQAMGKINKK